MTWEYGRIELEFIIVAVIIAGMLWEILSLLQKSHTVCYNPKTNVSVGSNFPPGEYSTNNINELAS